MQNAASSSVGLMIARIFILSLLATGVVAVGTALACSCVRFPTAAAQLQNADAMFIGRVEGTAVRPVDGYLSSTTRFRVTRTIKGPTRAVQNVDHSTVMGGMCGVTFQRGRSYTIIASANRGRLQTSSCSRPQFPIQDFERAMAP